MKRILMVRGSDGQERPVTFLHVGETWWCRSQVSELYCAFSVLSSGVVVAHVNVPSTPYVAGLMAEEPSHLVTLREVADVKAALREVK